MSISEAEAQAAAKAEALKGKQSGRGRGRSRGGRARGGQRGRGATSAATPIVIPDNSPLGIWARQVGASTSGAARRGRSTARSAAVNPILIPDEESNSGSDSNEDSFPLRTDSDDSDSEDEGIPGAYFGGYGHCYNCGKDICFYVIFSSILFKNQ